MIECVTQKDRQQLDGFKSLRERFSTWSQMAAIAGLFRSLDESILASLPLFASFPLPAASIICFTCFCFRRRIGRGGEMVDYKGQT